MNRILQTVVAVLCFTRVAIGQTPLSPDSTLQSILGSLEGTPLSLQQAVQHGLANATSLRAAEASSLAAEGAVRRESGQFDPTLFFTLNHLDQKLPTATFFAGAPTLSNRQTTSQGGLRMNLPTGTQLELGINSTRLATNSIFASLNPEYDTFGSLSIRQPLLGGFTSSARKQLTKSEQELDAATARHNQQELSVGVEIERMYWDLYAAERDYAVQRLTRDRAEAFLKDTELRARSGLVGPNQVANARTFLAQQTILLIEREEQLDRQSDQLASLIGVRPDQGKPRFLPTDVPPSEYVLDSVDALVDYALQNNLELQATQHDVEAQRILANAAGWEALPSVNLVGSIIGNGLGGTPQQVTFNGVTLPSPSGGSFGNALSQATTRDYPGWGIGVEVNVPIGLRSGLGEKERLDANVSVGEQRYIEQSRLLADQVRSAYRELAHGKSRLAAARDGVEAAQEQVRIGMIEFHNGRLTAFELVRLGEDFAVAEQRYSQALVRTAKAAATLRQLTSGKYPSATNN